MDNLLKVLADEMEQAHQAEALTITEENDIYQAMLWALKSSSLNEKPPA